MLKFEGRLELDVNGESAELTGAGSEVRIEARRPLHFLLAARSGQRIGGLQTIARELSRAKVRVTIMHRGRAVASIGHDVRADFPAKLLGIENVRFGRMAAAFNS